MTAARTLLITDLDNTLWDWFAAWHASFSAMLARLEAQSGVPAAVLEPEIRKIHQQRGTTEYSYLLNEVPALIEAAQGVEPMTAFDDALHVLYSIRRKTTSLYPGVREAVSLLRSHGVQIVGYTESIAFWAEWRIKHTGLDGDIEILYSAEDHDLPHGISFDDMRHGDDADYGLKTTVHHHLPRGIVKPSPDILLSIVSDCGKLPSEAVYVGDSLMKDVAMAQRAGVLDVHAKYGEPLDLEAYSLLQRVSHWPDRDVAREQQLKSGAEVQPTHVLEQGFGEILEIFEIKGTGSDL